MILTVDEVLTKIGPYGRTQKLLDVVFFVMNLPVSMQFLITTFTAVTPSWKCVNNSTECLHNNTRLGNDRSRCDLPRLSWDYTEPKEFSLVTQFDIHCKDEWLLILLYSIFFLGWGLRLLLGLQRGHIQLVCKASCPLVGSLLCNAKWSEAVGSKSGTPRICSRWLFFLG